MQMRIAACVAGVWLSVTGFVAVQQPAEFKIPPEEAKKENPVKASDSSIADGKRIYKIDCAMCHGEQGDGKTELAASMELNLRDLREPARMKEYTDGALAFLILKGKGKMPGEEGRLKGNQVWNVVNYLRSVVKKEEPAEKKNPGEEKKPPQ